MFQCAFMLQTSTQISIIVVSKMPILVGSIRFDLGFVQFLNYVLHFFNLARMTNCPTHGKEICSFLVIKDYFFVNLN
jgi:hypothetical protein